MMSALGRRNVLTGLLVASPIVAFPFSRSYTIFCVLIIVVGVLDRGARSQWRQHPGVLFAGGATGLPILLTILALWVQQGAVEILWVEKFTLIAAATLLGLAAAGLLVETEARRVVALAITLTLALWVTDGLLQLFIGYDMFGVPVSSELGPARVKGFFSKATRYGYFVAFLVIPPALWLLSKPKSKWLAHLLVACGAMVVFAAGSRYAMVGYGFFVMIYIIVVALSLKPKLRLAVLLGAPVLLLSLSSLMFVFNDSFQSRVLQTSAVLQKFDRETVNHALSLRLDVWEPAMEMIANRWVVGYGPSEFENQVGDYLDADSPFAGDTRIMHAHQVVIEILLGTGFIGLAAFIAYYVWLTRYLWLRREQAACFGWGCLLAYLLLWLPFGSQKDFYGSEQVLVSFYLLGLGFGFTGYSDEPEVIDKHLDE